MMKARGLLFVCILVPAMAAGAAAQILPPPPSWALNQNTPDPFCGTTVIEFGLAQNAHAQLAVWNDDQTAIVRQLVDGMLAAGLYTVAWDGLDDQGADVPDGQYPYRLVAQVDGATAFDSTLVLHVQCNVAAGERTWGALKGSYRP